MTGHLFAGIQEDLTACLDILRAGRVDPPKPIRQALPRISFCIGSGGWLQGKADQTYDADGRSGRTQTIPLLKPAEPMPKAALNRSRFTSVR
jgi:hypothetical protein